MFNCSSYIDNNSVLSRVNKLSFSLYCNVEKKTFSTGFYCVTVIYLS